MHRFSLFSGLRSVHALLAALFIASALPAVAAAAGPAPTVLRVAAVSGDEASGKPSFTGTPQLIANDAELLAELKKRNIELQWVPAANSAVATLVNESFANHRIDFAYYGDLPSVILNASGVHTQLIVPGGLGFNAYLVVPAASTAKTLADLKGKRIALHRGRPWEVSFAKLLASQGYTFKDFRIVNLNPQAGTAALAAGNVDAFFTLYDAHLLADKGVGRIIWSSHNSPDDWKMRAELWGDADYVKQHPDITQLLATATVRATHWVSQEANREAFIHDQARFGLPENVLRREYAGNRVSWKEFWSPLFTPVLTRHYQGVIDHARSTGLIRGNVEVNSLLAPQFVPVALQQLGLGSYWKK